MSEWQQRLRGKLGAAMDTPEMLVPLASSRLVEEAQSVRLAEQHLRRATQAAEIVRQDWVQESDRPGLYLVSSNGKTLYAVDTNERTCQCADHQHRHALCKHLQAADVVEAWLRQEAAEQVELWAA